MSAFKSVTSTMDPYLASLYSALYHNSDAFHSRIKHHPEHTQKIIHGVVSNQMNSVAGEPKSRAHARALFNSQYGNGEAIVDPNHFNNGMRLLKLSGAGLHELASFVDKYEQSCDNGPNCSAKRLADGSRIRKCSC
jgi:hypothetical protein